MKKILFYIKHLKEKLASSIEHRNILKIVYKEVQITNGYFVNLILANLIALNGLIQNSTAVIIGAMLISPLMGPILSFGFAFITGDNFIWIKSIKKISLSIVITILVAAIASYLSPLKDVTSEIFSRTRPNLYDLIIAFLAGTAGATAICTKENYITIVTGVAIATAVIPPLSVTGFGIGTGNLIISFGGFILFFTNFIAITIATSLVFYLYGFKPSIISEANISALKKRVIILVVVLALLSIPLVYTLYQSISEIKLRTNIQKVLKEVFEKTGLSTLSSFKYSKEENGKLRVYAIINTVDYFKESEISTAEKNLVKAIKRNVKLDVEQIKVQPGGLKDQPISTAAPTIVPPKVPQEIMKGSRENLIELVKQSLEKIEKLIFPAIISDFFLGFHDKTSKVSIALKIKKDRPLTKEEIIILKEILSSELNLPVLLNVETIPLLPLLKIKNDEATLSNEIKEVITTVKYLYAKDKNISVTIEVLKENTNITNKNKLLYEKHIKKIVGILVKECNISQDNIKIVTKKTKKTTGIKISLMSNN